MDSGLGVEVDASETRGMEWSIRVICARVRLESSRNSYSFRLLDFCLINENLLRENTNEPRTTYGCLRH